MMNSTTSDRLLFQKGSLLFLAFVTADSLKLIRKLEVSVSALCRGKPVVYCFRLDMATKRRCVEHVPRAQPSTSILPDPLQRALDDVVAGIHARSESTGMLVLEDIYSMRRAIESVGFEG